MAQTDIQLAQMPETSVVTYPFGQVRDRIRRADIVGELRSRNYLGCETGGDVAPMGQTYSTTSRVMAVRRAVDDALKRHNKPANCRSGCYLPDAIWDSIVRLGELLANRYYDASGSGARRIPLSPAYSPPARPYSPPAYRPPSSPIIRSPIPRTEYVYGGRSPVPGVPWVTSTPSPSPVPVSPRSPTVSPSWQSLQARFTSYFRGAPGPLGQTPPLVTVTPPAPGAGWTPTEKWAFALDLLSKGLAWATSYLQAKAERDRMIAMGTQIPQMTAQEVQQLLMQYKMLNPGVDNTQLKNVGAGLMGQPKPSAIPTWVWPMAAGLGVLGVMVYMKKGR